MKSRLTRDMNFLFYNRVLQSSDSIDEWEQSEICCLAKKGNNKDPENSRLVALLDTLYKTSSRMATKPILDHIDASIRNTQFWFREKHGCADALLVLRVLLEKICKISESDTTMIFLDWKKRLTA